MSIEVVFQNVVFVCRVPVANAEQVRTKLEAMIGAQLKSDGPEYARITTSYAVPSDPGLAPDAEPTPSPWFASGHEIHDRPTHFDGNVRIGTTPNLVATVSRLEDVPLITKAPEVLDAAYALLRMLQAAYIDLGLEFDAKPRIRAFRKTLEAAKHPPIGVRDPTDRRLYNLSIHRRQLDIFDNPALVWEVTASHARLGPIAIPFDSEAAAQKWVEEHKAQIAE